MAIEAKTLLVQFFTIEQTRSSTAISRIAYAFGADIPRPMSWEGGPPGIRYLFCARANTPIEDICKQHGWTLKEKPAVQEVPEDLFKTESHASLQYGKEPRFVLRSDLK